MSEETCILTTKDLTILEIMLERCLAIDESLAPLLRRKISTAQVVFRDDVPENVATLSSRVTFSVDGRHSDTRIISHDRMTSPIGMFIPITSPRGLALLGLAEGQEFRLPNHDGVEERILLENVHYQPEAAKRAKEAATDLAATGPDRPFLRLVTGGALRKSEPLVVPPDGFDDPGPSAA
jgi:regulator of nucleoside diphosphate kinase